MNKDYVGIIIPNDMYERMPRLSDNVQSMLNIWEETGAKNHVTVCYFRFYDIQPNQTVLKAYIKENNAYVLKQLPAPDIIYSRVLDHLPKNRAHIKSLVDKGKVIFNIPNYDVEKYKVHELLVKDPFIRQYLPETGIFTIAALNRMAKKYDKLILKRNYGEFGIGAMKLEKVDNHWLLSYKTGQDKELKQIPFKKALPVVCQKRLQKYTYLVQEMIPLSTYNENPFDMRVALQKNIHGEFQVSAIMCKVAKENDFLTNGSQGATTRSLEEIAPYSHPSIPYETLEKNIQQISLYTANYLDKHFPSIADLGFDIAITKEGIPYFIECNFISDYVNGLFKDGKLVNQAWSSVFSTPIDYAKYLIKKRCK